MRVTTANVGSIITAAIPELREDMDEWVDLEHLQFMEIFRWTESSLQGGNTENLHRAICLVDSIFQDCDPAIGNAVTVAFLENIDPDDGVGKKIFDALTPALQKQWLVLDDYRVKLIGKSLRGSVARNASSTRI